MAAIGRQLTIPVTSAIRVESNSWSSWELPICVSMTSRTLRMVRIWRSHTPPKWDAWGGLKIHSQSLSVAYRWILCWSASVRVGLSSDFPPTKLVPRSQRILEKCEEPSQCADEGTGIHTLEELNVDGSGAEACEHQAPSLRIGGASPKFARAYEPWTKYVESDAREGCAWFGAVFRQVRHVLCYWHPSCPLAGNAWTERSCDCAMPRDYPVTSLAHGSVRNLPFLVVHRPVVVANQ